MSVEPPFNEPADPDRMRDVDGIPTWIVEEVNDQIREYYANSSGTPTLAEVDERYFVWGNSLHPDEHPPIYQLPKQYCVYVLYCEYKGFDNRSSIAHVKRVLQHRAEGIGYDCPDDWMEAVYHSGPPHYVGLTNNPYARVHEHVPHVDSDYPFPQIQEQRPVGEHGNIVVPNSRGADFTQMFPPSAVQSIEWVDDRRKAETIEQKTANRLYNKNGNFVHPPPAD